MSKQEKLLKIIIIELEDVIEDLNALAETYKTRLEAGEITDYVYKENTSLLRNEQACVKEYLKALQKIDVSVYEDEKQAALGLKQVFINLLREHCYAKAVENIVEIKIDKSLDFISSPP